ncbi:MAG: ATP-binding protein [Candidatus Omnitrophica bacterium]|nr:ATP-binding protein [Candidatus Omnitrophota bacterium]
MENKIPENQYIKFVSELVACVRKISIYPSKHPIVIESIKNIYAALGEIFKNKSSFSLIISADNKILIEGEQLADKNLGLARDILPFLKKLNIENLTFNSGISEKEIEDFVKIISLESEQIKSVGISGAFQDRGIKNIKIDQFSYINIQKDKETLVLEKGLSGLDHLKSQIKDYSQGKLGKPEDIRLVEEELFRLMSFEIKENRKLSLPVKNIFKKFLQANSEKQDTLKILKDALINYGCPEQDVEAFIGKIQADISRGPVHRAGSIPKSEFDALQKENERLKQEVSGARRKLDEQGQALEKARQENKTISDEKDRINNIVRHMGDGLVVVDPQGKILIMNQQAESLLGVEKKDVGRPIKELIKDEHLLTLVKNISQDKDGVMEKDIELFSQNESTKRVVRASSAIVEDQNGKTVGMVTTLNDITKQRELDHLKSNFVANVSHELRTPLVAIDKSLSLILEKAAGEVSGAQEQFLSIAQRNLKRLSLLINDLLDISKLEAGKMRLEFRPSSMEKVIGDSLEGLNVWARTKSINIQKQVQENLPELEMDPNRIIQVLNNLIGNAIKFTPENGSITIRAQAGEKKDTVEVSIQDTGIGIDKQNLEKIFDKFYQIGERTSSDIGGTGIGLSIAKEIIELHGGKIWVASAKDQGTKFSFGLPLKQKEIPAQDNTAFASGA